VAKGAVPFGYLRIPYRRADGKYSGWTVYAFDTTQDTGG